MSHTPRSGESTGGGTLGSETCGFEAVWGYIQAATDTYLSEKPVSEAVVPTGLSAAGSGLDKDTGDSTSWGLQGVWSQEGEDGRHSRDFMTAEDTRLLMEYSRQVSSSGSRTSQDEDLVRGKLRARWLGTLTTGP